MRVLRDWYIQEHGEDSGASPDFNFESLSRINFAIYSDKLNCTNVNNHAAAYLLQYSVEMLLLSWVGGGGGLRE